jgi:hypothetical protein
LLEHFARDHAGHLESHNAREKINDA